MPNWLILLFSISLLGLAASRSRHHRQGRREGRRELQSPSESRASGSASESVYQFELELQRGLTLRWTYTDENLEFALDMRVNELRSASGRTTSGAVTLVGFGIADRGLLEATDALVLRVDALANMEEDIDAIGRPRNGLLQVPFGSTCVSMHF